MVIFPILIAVLIYFMVSKGRMHHPMRMKGQEALEKLKIRFVNGEIDEEAYLKMKATLAE